MTQAPPEGLASTTTALGFRIPHVNLEGHKAHHGTRGGNRISGVTVAQGCLSPTSTGFKNQAEFSDGASSAGWREQMDTKAAMSL